MSSHSDDQSANTPKPLLAALNRLLKPLVRLLIHFNISYPYFSQMLKTLYIQAAAENFPDKHGKPPSDSRISLITGVHRKDVRKLRDTSSDASRPARNTSIGAQLLAHWLGDKAYTDKHNQPRALQRLARDSKTVSFESLVQAVCKGDLRPKVILDELLRQNIVSINSQGLVELNQQAFIPCHDLEEKSFYFGKNIHDHLAAGAANLIACEQQQSAPFIDRCVYYDGLSDESVGILNAMIEEQGMELLKTVNRKALSLQKTDKKLGINTQGNSQRINLGLYFYHHNEDSPEQEQTDEP
jgi:hypothetical protein